MILPSDAPVIVALLAFLTFLGSSVLALLLRRADLRDKRQARADAEERDQAMDERRREDRREVLEAAQELEAKAERRAKELAETMLLQDKVRHLELNAKHREVLLLATRQHGETLARVAQVQTTAAEAFNEANHLNVKIQEVAEATHKVQSQVAEALGKIPSVEEIARAAAIAPAEASGATISGTFVGTPDAPAPAQAAP